MIRRERVALFATFISLGMMNPAPAFACSCTGPIPFPEALVSADSAFIGEVVSVRYKASLLYRATMRVRELWANGTGSSDPGLRDWYRSPSFGRVAVLRVVEPLKGASGHTIAVHYGPLDDCMGYPFVVGEKYLVFAYLMNEVAPGGPQRLEVNSCGMSRPLAEVQDAVKELRASSQVGSK